MSDEMTRWALFLLFVFIGTAVLVSSLMRYVCIGWWAKRKDIMDGLNADARRAYFAMFSRDEGKAASSDPISALEDFHYKWYGRKHFIWPGILLFLISICATGFITSTGLSRLGYPVFKLFVLPDTAMAAISGAYLWVADDQISRARRLDFSPSDLQWGTLRLVIAIPMGYCFGRLAASGLAPFIAFGLGAFPLGALITILRRISNKKLGLNDDADSANDEVIKLQGINKNILERLQNEDISTISQIAYCDPIRLVMRANLDFIFVTDCMSQALAWIYFEEKLVNLRPYGLRGAVEIRAFVEELDIDPQTTDSELKRCRDIANDALPVIANAMQIPVAGLQITLRQIAQDPYTNFLYQVWSATDQP